MIDKYLVDYLVESTDHPPELARALPQPPPPTIATMTKAVPTAMKATASGLPLRQLRALA